MSPFSGAIEKDGGSAEPAPRISSAIALQKVHSESFEGLRSPVEGVESFECAVRELLGDAP